MKRLASSIDRASKILGAATRVLLRYRLCDRCLGRLFARLGKGLDNAERGKTIRTFLSMIFADLEDTSSLREDNCYICRSSLDTIMKELAESAIKSLRESKARISSFLVGVKTGSEIERREQEVIGVLGLDTWESVRREVKRFVGKAIARELGLTPDFANPDILIVLDLTQRKAHLKIPPLVLKGRYVKLGRLISQMPWLRRDGTRKYSLSVYDVCESLLGIFNGSRLVLHAAGREDADSRMLGDGRPIALEIKEALNRELPRNNVRAIRLEREPWIYVILEDKAARRYVRTIKTRPTPKVYRAVVFSPEGLSVEDLEKVEKLSGRVIVQRTPTRVLKRRKDIARRRKVYEVRASIISKYLMEVLMRVDGGLYVKELVDGDGGRTSPSFSEVTGKRMRVVFLDVLKIEELEPSSR